MDRDDDAKVDEVVENKVANRDMAQTSLLCRAAVLPACLPSDFPFCLVRAHHVSAVSWEGALFFLEKFENFFGKLLVVKCC